MRAKLIAVENTIEATDADGCDYISFAEMVVRAGTMQDARDYMADRFGHTFKYVCSTFFNGEFADHTFAYSAV